MRADSLILKQKRILTAFEEATIRQSFCDNVSAKKVAFDLKLSERCIRQRYQNLRGYPLKPRQLEKSLAVKRRRQEPGGYGIKDPPPKLKKPLVNLDRFYKSTFEPA